MHDIISGLIELGVNETAAGLYGAIIKRWEEDDPSLELINNLKKRLYGYASDGASVRSHTCCKHGGRRRLKIG